MRRSTALRRTRLDTLLRWGGAKSQGTALNLRRRSRAASRPHMGRQPRAGAWRQLSGCCRSGRRAQSWPPCGARWPACEHSGTAALLCRAQQIAWKSQV
eukprot:3907514-Pyramimonas_sp.AAC.1